MHYDKQHIRYYFRFCNPSFFDCCMFSLSLSGKNLSMRPSTSMHGNSFLVLTQMSRAKSSVSYPQKKFWGIFAYPKVMLASSFIRTHGQRLASIDQAPTKISPRPFHSIPSVPYYHPLLSLPRKDRIGRDGRNGMECYGMKWTRGIFF